MAKNIEPYEEDYLLEDQNSTEEPLVEEDEELDDDSPLRVKPRPARASLTHNAVKSELSKMNRQNNSQRQDSGDDNDENLSRSARKRKKRREKVLEERRASGGRGDNFEDDLAHFKSIPISRRRSSVLPLQTISISSYNNDEGGLCSKLRCFLWVLLVVGTLIGLIYVWPTVAELDLELAEQANLQEKNENQIQPETTPVNNEIDADQIIDQINKLSEELNDDQADEEIKNDDEEESLTTLGYLSSFFKSDSPDLAVQDDEQASVAPDEEETNDQDQNIENRNGDDDEQNIEPAPTAVDYQVDEGFEEQEVVEPNDNNDNDDNGQQIIVEAESLAESSLPQRYQSVGHQQDNLEGEQSDSCIIDGQLYNNLDGEQCSFLQERQYQLEQRLREQEMQQEQQANDEEQFYFF